MRDSHGLFDYESKSINKKSLKTSAFGKIVRVNNDIELVGLHKNELELPTNEGSEPPQTLLQIRGNASKYLFMEKYLLTLSQIYYR